MSRNGRDNHFQRSVGKQTAAGMRKLVTRPAGQHPLRIFQTPAGEFSEAPSVPARVLAARNVNHVAAGHSANTHVQGRMWAGKPG